MDDAMKQYVEHGRVEARKYPDALVERAFANVRAFAAKPDDTIENREARAIVAELPAEVDADLVEARKLAAEEADDDFHRDMCLDGTSDEAPAVLWRYRAIKRGRALEREQAGEGRGA